MTGPVPTRDQAFARLGRVLAASCERQYGGRWTSVPRTSDEPAHPTAGKVGRLPHRDNQDEDGAR